MNGRTLAVITVTGIALLGARQAQADILANWTFETSAQGSALVLSNSTTSPNAVAEGGIFAASSIASGFHASAATDWSTPAGNGSAFSFSVNTWAIGDYWQFTTSTVGYENITISWDQTRSGTGPTTFDLEYSTDGTNWATLVDDYTVLENIAGNGGTWNTTTNWPNYSFSPVLAPGVLDNMTTIYFRMTSQVTPGAGGTNRIDNVIISGDAIPAPGVLALLGVAGLIGRTRRRA